MRTPPVCHGSHVKCQVTEVKKSRNNFVTKDLPVPFFLQTTKFLNKMYFVKGFNKKRFSKKYFYYQNVLVTFFLSYFFVFFYKTYFAIFIVIFFNFKKCFPFFVGHFFFFLKTEIILFFQWISLSVCFCHPDTPTSKGWSILGRLAKNKLH